MCDDLLGRVLGDRFLIIEALGEGGMGSVFRGVQLDGSRDVAIKILRPELAGDPIVRARFHREARMAAQINHPNAVQMLDTGTDGGLPYLVMELVEGRELFRVLAEEGRLCQDRAVAMAVQVCDALATAHDLGIIHRDLKPENVMLVPDPESPHGERVKLLDFGVAKRVGPVLGGEEESLTLSGAIVGTPAYMAPEQCRGDALDGRTDVYACGALLYHLVTGRAPFEDECPLETLYRHMHEPPRAPSALVPGLDEQLCATILKALAKHPGDRQQSAHVLHDELEAMLPRLSNDAGARDAAPPMPTTTFGACDPWAPTLPHLTTPPDGAPWTRRPAPADPRPPRERARRPLRRWGPVLAGIAAASAALWLSGQMNRVPSRVDPSSVVSSGGHRRVHDR
jgi:eukaryotic-like serine/threonine-protein kinase